PRGSARASRGLLLVWPGRLGQPASTMSPARTALWRDDTNRSGGPRPLISIAQLSLVVGAPTVRRAGCRDPACMGRSRRIAAGLERDERESPLHGDRPLAAREPARAGPYRGIDAELTGAAVTPAIGGTVRRHS